MTELTDLQKVAFAQAIVDALEDRLCGTGRDHPDSLRAKVDEDLRELYDAQGVDRQRVMFGGEQVAVLSATISKPREVLELSIEDTSALVDWLQGTQEGRGVIYALLNDTRARATLIKALQKHFDLQGELPDGCKVQLRQYPAEWKHTRMKPDGDAMARVVGSLTGAVRMLELPDGDE